MEQIAEAEGKKWKREKNYSKVSVRLKLKKYANCTLPRRNTNTLAPSKGEIIRVAQSVTDWAAVLDAFDIAFSTSGGHERQYRIDCPHCKSKKSIQLWLDAPFNSPIWFCSSCSYQTKAGNSYVDLIQFLKRITHSDVLDAIQEIANKKKAGLEIGRETREIQECIFSIQ